MKRSRLKRIGPVTRKWIAERKQWFVDNPADVYYCHYCEGAMDQQNTTLDHENNRNHKGRILPCCWNDNNKKGSVSHDKYVARYYPNHKCN